MAFSKACQTASVSVLLIFSRVAVIVMTSALNLSATWVCGHPRACQTRVAEGGRKTAPSSDLDRVFETSRSNRTPATG